MSAARDFLPTIERAPYEYRADATIPAFPDDRPLIVFDGYCGLCSRLVQFVLKHDRKRIYRLLPAQTPLGDALYRHFGLDAEDYDTFILLKDGKGYFVSDAAIELFRSLGFPSSMLGSMKIVPPRLRDRVYLAIAHNRMRVFGRSDACYLHAPEEADRFMSGERPAANASVWPEA